MDVTFLWQPSNKLKGGNSCETETLNRIIDSIVRELNRIRCVIIYDSCKSREIE